MVQRAPWPGLLAALLAGTAWASEAERQEALSPGPGRALVLESCVQCHDLKAVVSQRKPASAWRRTVNEMIWRGAPLQPGEARVVTEYLAASFGPAPPAPRVPRRVDGAGTGTVDDGARLPPGPGRALVRKACVQCHDLRTTVAARKTAEEWRRSVDQMARLGARLNGSELEVVADYLARAFGPGGPR